MVFALPAANAPPTSVTTQHPDRTGRPRCASSIVGIVVTRRSSMIRGLVRANSDRATTRAERRPAATGSASVAGVTLSPPSFPVSGVLRLAARRCPISAAAVGGRVVGGAPQLARLGAAPTTGGVARSASGSAPPPGRGGEAGGGGDGARCRGVGATGLAPESGRCPGTVCGLVKTK